MQKMHHSHHRIVIQLPDTNVAVLCKVHFHDLECQELWFHTGVKDGMRFIPPLHSALGQLLCKALPAFCALTGCNSTSALQRIGKKTAWTTLLKENRLQQQLSQSGGDPDFNESTLRSGEELVCTSYSTKNYFAKAQDVHYYPFCQKNNKSEELPPTVDSLDHHIRQANYQIYVWKQAILSMLTLPSPDGNG